MPYIPSTAFELGGGAYVPSSAFLFRYAPAVPYQPVPALQVRRAIAAASGRAVDAAAVPAWGWLQARDPSPALFGAARARAVDAAAWQQWGWPVATDRAVGLAHAWGVVLDPRALLPWGRPVPTDRRAGRFGAIAAALWLDAAWLSPWNRLLKVDRAAVDEWQSTARQRREAASVAYQYGPTAFRFDAGEAYRPSTSFQFSRVPPVRPPIPRDRSSAHPWGWGTTLRAENIIPWGEGRRLRPVDIGVEYPDYDGPIKAPPPEPDIRESYQIVNLINVVALPSETPIDVAAIQIGLDIDAFAWTLTCDVLTAEAMALLKPDPDPAELRITINGHDWVFMVEKWNRVRAVGHRYRINASSRTRYLAAPYAPRRSHIDEGPLNAKQAAEAELQNTGFTIDWHPNFTDWSIPGGVWSYTEKTPIEAISAICEAAGAVIVPDPATDTLHIQPRYYDAPWEWASTIVDAVVHDAMIEDQDGEHVPGTPINGIWVSGINAGVQVEVVRAGTAGDELGQDILHDLITDQAVGAARGKQEIAASGPHTLENLTVQITDEQASPGLILPGYIIEVQGEETWRGLVLSNSISAPGNGAPRINQRLAVERRSDMEIH